MKRWVCDIETLPNLFMLCVEDMDSDKRFDFILWKHRNDLSKMYKFLDFCIENKHIHITFNGLGFDSQVLQWFLNNKNLFNPFQNLDNIDVIIDQSYKKAQECISRSNLNQFQDYPEWKLQTPQIDLFKLGHYDNPSKMSSLKWLECGIDWPDVNDMPFDHTHYIENESELALLKSYCYNDVGATKKIAKLFKDGIDLRQELSREYRLNLNSASEPRLAKELFLHFLSAKTGIEKKELKKYGTLRETIKIKDILLPYIKFERQEFIMLLNNFRTLEVRGDSLKGSFKYKVHYRGLEIDYGVGGIHGFSKEDKYITNDTHIIKTSDVKSYYPNLAINNEWAPAHINKKAFCEQYKTFYVDRTKFPKGSAKNYLYKILLNSTFGLSIDKTSFLSDPQLGVQITVNGQLLLTMLLEMICEAIPDAQPIMLNTDGLEVKIKRQDEAKYLEVCKQWEAITKLELEHDIYKSLFAFDCNNFIGVLNDGKIKCKGRFEYEPHDKYETNVLHKNKSFLVVCKGIYQYFVNGLDPDTFVRQHRNIYDFCGFARSKGKWKFIQITSTGEGVIEKPIQKTLRYYMSRSGSKVIKRNQDDGREIQVVAGRGHLTVFNRYQDLPWDQYDIDYSWYVKEINKEIRMLEKEQLTLF